MDSHKHWVRSTNYTIIDFWWPFSRTRVRTTLLLIWKTIISEVCFHSEILITFSRPRSVICNKIVPLIKLFNYHFSCVLLYTAALSKHTCAKKQTEEILLPRAFWQSRFTVCQSRARNSRQSIESLPTVCTTPETELTKEMSRIYKCTRLTLSWFVAD
jgi:hypothetical protein